MRTIMFPVKGLNFAGCTREIEKQLGKLAPIQQVEASYISQTVTVTYDETRLGEAQLREMVKECGYACGDPVTSFTVPGETVSQPREVDQAHQAMIHTAMDHAAEVSVAAKADMSIVDHSMMAHDMSDPGMAQAMEADMRYRFFVSLVLTIPVILYSSLGTNLFKLLWEALMAELSGRTFEEIAVIDICERAMVHRTTFYKHYEDKYALLEQGIRQMYDDLLAEEEYLPPSAYSVEHPPPYFIRLFEHAAQHQRFYKLMLCGEGIGRFQKLVKVYIADMVSTKVGELALANQPFAVPLDMHAHFVSGATLSLLAWWLEHDMPFSPHQMAQYLLAPHGDLSFSS